MTPRSIASALALIGLTLAPAARAGADPSTAESAATAPGTDSGSPGGIEAGWSIGYDSHYIFRGELLQKNTLWTEISFDLPVTEKLSFNLTPWFLQDMDDDYNEVDLTGTLTLALASWEFSAAYAEFYYPRRSLGAGEGIRDEQEAAATISRSVGALTATVLGAYSFTRKGFYYEAAAEFELALSDALSLTPCAAFGVDTDYFGEGTDTNHVTLTLTIAYTPFPWCTVSPYLAGNLPMGHLDTDESISGGVKLTATF
jgi:hypothetical protein